MIGFLFFSFFPSPRAKQKTRALKNCLDSCTIGNSFIRADAFVSSLSLKKPWRSFSKRPDTADFTYKYKYLHLCRTKEGSALPDFDAKETNESLLHKGSRGWTLPRFTYKYIVPNPDLKWP